MEVGNDDTSQIRFLICQEALFKLVFATSNKNFKKEEDKYAEALVRKNLLHLLSIRNILEQGRWFSILEGRDFSYLLDPLSSMPIVRAIYESMLTFNHIYINTTNKNEIELRFYLWVLSTLLSKNNTKSVELEESKEARETNRREIQHVVKRATEIATVEQLDERSLQLITNKQNPGASERDWAYFIDGNILKPIQGSWHTIASRIRVKEGVFDNLYKLFSLESHPTYHSIYKVINIFESNGSGRPDNYEMMYTTLHFCTMLTCFIIYDYCEYFPEVKKEFANLPKEHTMLINSCLQTFKGERFVL